MLLKTSDPTPLYSLKEWVSTGIVVVMGVHLQMDEAFEVITVIWRIQLAFSGQWPVKFLRISTVLCPAYLSNVPWTLCWWKTCL